MSSAYGHTLTRLSPLQLNDCRERRGGVVDPARMRCGAPNCFADFCFVASYRYVTGRAGRVTRADREYCEAHAVAFAKKNKLEVP